MFCHGYCWPAVHLALLPATWQHLCCFCIQGKLALCYGLRLGKSILTTTQNVPKLLKTNQGYPCEWAGWKLGKLIWIFGSIILSKPEWLQYFVGELWTFETVQSVGGGEGVTAKVGLFSWGYNPIISQEMTLNCYSNTTGLHAGY